MHSTRLCKNILIVLLAFSALFGVVACSNLSGGDAPVNSAIQPANGVGVVRGTINSNQSAARTALPTEPTASKYKITATASGFATVEQEFLTTDFELALPYNGSTTWTLKASALDATNAEVMSGTATVTLSDATPTAAQDINIAYSQTGTGSVDLNISWSAASGIKNVKYELVRGSTKITGTATTSPLTISQTDLAAGAYSLAVEFYGADNSLLYRIDETVNVYANLETTQFESGAPYISGGGIDVDQNLLDNFKISTIYVGGRGLISNTAANDSNNGSQFAPLATLKKAVEKANVTGAGIENIIVQGNTTEAEYPAWAEIIYTGAVPLTVTGKGANRSTTVAVNGNFVTRGDLTIKNLTLSGAELTVENSGVLTVNEATLQDHTGWGAGGIKIVDNGKATVTNCTIKDNQVINDPNANPVWGGTGGGLSINTTSTVELKNCIIQNNTAQRMGGAIYIAAATKVTLENCTITGNTAGTSGGAIYMATGANLSISGNTVIGGTGANANTAAQDGGGICIQGGELKFSGGTITGNKATTGKGTGIYNNASLIMSGTAQVASGNDIFLATVSSINKTITINDEFDSAITTVAYLTLEGHAVDDTVLEKGGTLTAITPAICNKFKLLKADGTEDTAHKIAPNALNDAGILADAAQKLAKVYLKGTGGDDSNDGSTAANAVATLAKAVEILDQDDTNPTIIICSPYTLNSTDIDCLSFDKVVTIKRYYKTSTDYCKGNLITVSSATGSNITVPIKNVVFEGNKTALSGAACASLICTNYYSNTITFDNVTLQNNASTTNGGALFISSSTVKFIGETLITDNSAASNGGAICYSGIELEFNNNVFIVDNFASKGNGVYVNDSNFKISGGTIEDDIYLNGYTIIIGNASTSNLVGSVYITLPDDKYVAGTQVLDLTAITEANRATVCGKFKLLDPDGTENTDYVIKPDSADSKKGVLADATAKLATVHLKVSGGDDAKSGDSYSNAVATLERALEILDTTADTPTIKIYGYQTLNYILKNGENLDFSAYSKPITIERSNYYGGMIEINSSSGPNGDGKVTLDNVIINGKKETYTGSSIKSILYINSGCEVTINETTPGTTILKNNENKSSGGGAIYNEGTLTINGGTITGNTAASSNNGGGIYNEGTLTINGGTISDNTANKGGGIFAYGGKTTISNGSNINIIGNIANNNGGGICNNLYNSEVEINGGNISGNTAGNNGGGVSNASIITFTGGTISGNMLNGSGSGKDIYNNATMQMSGTVIADEVYLNRGKYITVTGAFSHAATIKAAKIVLNNSTTPSQYAAGTQVLAAGGTLSEITPGICDKFVLLDKDDPTIASTEFNIVPNPADTTQGILAAAQGSGGIILALADTYNISFTGLTSGTIQRGSTLSFTVTNSSGTEPTATYTTVIKQNGTEFKSSATNSIVIPSTLPAGVYDIYITITVGSNTYDYTKQITVTI